MFYMRNKNSCGNGVQNTGYIMIRISLTVLMSEICNVYNPNKFNKIYGLKSLRLYLF